MSEQEKSVKDMNEQELRNRPGAWPKTMDALCAEIVALVERDHDYGTCVYAASMAAQAAFNYVLTTLGCTGFQASCADLDFLRRTRQLEDGFMLLDGSKVLYPQYDLRRDVERFIQERSNALKEKAKKLLKEKGSAHPDVRARWEEIANGEG